MTTDHPKPRAIFDSGRVPRRSGYVRQSDIDRYGSFRAALAELDKEQAA